MFGSPNPIIIVALPANRERWIISTDRQRGIMRKETLNQPSDGLLVYSDIVDGEPIVLQEHEQVWTPSQFALGLARLIAEQAWTHAHVLDLASGSGILGLVALR